MVGNVCKSAFEVGGGADAFCELIEQFAPHIPAFGPALVPRRAADALEARDSLRVGAGVSHSSVHTLPEGQDRTEGDPLRVEEVGEVEALNEIVVLPMLFGAERVPLVQNQELLVLVEAVILDELDLLFGALEEVGDDDDGLGLLARG